MQKLFPAAALLVSIATFAQPVYADGKSALRAACKEDMQAYCKGIKPGGGRIAACMKEHESQVSSGCKSAISQARAEHKGKAAQAPVGQ